MDMVWFYVIVGLIIFFALVVATFNEARDKGVSFDDVKDYVRHNDEYKTLGEAGERWLYRSLLEVGFSEEQIFRNVYIPAVDKFGKYNGKTTEIDVLALSKKGILIFEHKALSGNIYGDGEKEQWIQYLADKKYFFRSPVEQNRYHKKCLKKYIRAEVPIYTFITTSDNGKWKVRNISKEDHFIEQEGEFKEIYFKLPDSARMKAQYKNYLNMFSKKSRPTDGTREKHIREFCL